MKILASDFDGTLYFPQEGGLRPGDIRAIEEFQERGHKFGLSTGRPLEGVRGMLGEKIRPDFYVLCSGALVLTGDLEPIHACPMDPAGVKLVLDLWTSQPRQGLGVVFTRREVYIPDDFYHSDFVRKNPAFAGLFLPLSQLNQTEEPVYGISLSCGSELLAEELLDQMRKEGMLDQVQAFQNCTSLDLVAPGCSKAKGLEKLKAYYGITQPVACIGDSYNDLPMLQSTPRSFTFTTSPRSVREKAAFLVESEAQAIRILLGQED